ncbi:acyltransferase family protein [Nocardioides sp. CCNWLW239]|uniref:acyltransferase family protein n=1 Tax=Nocardioides sp. CCNWLW239 TaxID=3128902 RepID=UPI003017CDB3
MTLAPPQPDPQVQTSARPQAERAQRVDIQALRALAVLLVVIYHFWPARLTGGYVGVDVFFVISGFLITTHLVQHPPTTPRDLAVFWGRRIRRLLPVALLVLGVSLVATWLVAPATLWRSTAVQAIASAVYGQNWVLAAEAVDYMAADNVPTAVQHYWSLSVEEQFYLGWPILILLSGLLVRRRGGSLLSGTACVIAVVTFVSFLCSAFMTPSSDAAYFWSWTRFWELGLGGIAALVAIWLPASVGGGRTLRGLLSWAGLAGILYAACTFDESTVFPGVAAVVPVVATALVILAQPMKGIASPVGLMGLRPVQWIGDVSYSVYLWHWPVVVLLPYLLGQPASWPVKLAAVGAVVMLSWGTKVMVEDRFRGSRPLGVPLRRSFVFALAGALVIGVGSVGLVRQASVETTSSVAAGADDPCFAAAALATDGCDPHGTRLYLPPLAAVDDVAEPFENGCVLQMSDRKYRTCSFGSEAKGATKIALVGNSHAAMWQPAFEQVATESGWNVTTYLMYECYTSDRAVRMRDRATTANCLRWNRHVLEELIQDEVDLVVFSNRYFRRMAGATSDQDSFRRARDSSERVLERLSRDGRRVLVLRDPPAPPIENKPDCVAANLDDLDACDGSLEDSVLPDPMTLAARDLDDPRVTVMDTVPSFCRDGTCFTTIGGVVVYYDNSHVTATYVRSLAGRLETAVDGALSG